MRSLFRLGIVVATALVFMVTPALGAQAQGNYCPKNLAASDCQLLQDAASNLKSTNSFAVDYTVTLVTVGTNSDINLNVTGNGAVDLSKVKGMAVTDQASAVKALQGLAVQNVLTADVTSGSQKTTATVELRLVDGVAYFKGDTMTQGKWMKLDLTKMQSSMGRVFPQMPSARPRTIDPALVSSVASAISSAISATSAAGPSVEGVTTQQITINIDVETLAQFMLSPDAASLFKSIAQAQGRNLTDAQLKQAQQQVQTMIRMLEPTLKATKVSEYVLLDPAAKQYRGFGINFSTTVDPTTIAMLSRTKPSANAKPVDVTFTLDVKLSKFNAPVSVQAVPDATDLSSGMGAGS